MQSNELVQEYDKVFKPYFTKLSNNSINSLDALKQYILSYDEDKLIVKFLRELYPQIDAVMSKIDEKNQSIFSCYIKNRFFSEVLAFPLATTALQNIKANEIVDFCTAIRHDFINFDLDNESAFFIDSNLARILSAFFAAQNIKNHNLHYEVPERLLTVVVDMSPENGVINAITDKSNCKKLYSFAYNPQMLLSLVRNAALREAAAHVSIVKTLLYTTPGLRVFYDQNGHQHINNAPVGINKDDFYITNSLHSCVKNFSPNLIKFEINPDNLNYFVSNDAGKSFSKHKVSLLAGTSFDVSPKKNTLNFDLNKSFADCLGIAALIERMNDLKSDYEIKMLLDTAALFRLQILFSIKEK